jgi:hypothetical protein
MKGHRSEAVALRHCATFVSCLCSGQPNRLVLAPSTIRHGAPENPLRKRQYVQPLWTRLSGTNGQHGVARHAVCEAPVFCSQAPDSQSTAHV